MFNGKSRLAIAALLQAKGWRIRYVCRLIGHIPVFRETTVLAEAGWRERHPSS
jgi:hypothetical protein